MGFHEEFSTVNLILNSGAETRGVDAFALSLIKAERQARKLFTFLIFQFPAFTKGDGRRLRRTLADNKQVFFTGVIAGIDALTPLTVKEMIGSEHDRLWSRFAEFATQRNKIFHGQLTADGLHRRELLQNAEDIQLWCRILSNSATREFGYDGFGRNSFRKSAIADLARNLRMQIGSHEEHAMFIRTQMERRIRSQKR
jgi:hypothetical protein